MVTEFKGEHAFLSNFWIHPIVHEGISFMTTEAAFQAAKTNHRDTKLKIASLSTPGKAKRAGGSRGILPDFDQVAWDAKKLQVMEDVCRLKFEDPQLREKLLATGDQELQEGNSWNDTFYGVCLKTNVGHNHLGKILMKIRSDIMVSYQK